MEGEEGGRAHLLTLPSVNREEVSLWLDQGEVGKLRHLVLQGRGGLLEGESSKVEEVQKFLAGLPGLQHQIQVVEVGSGAAQ